MWFAQDINCHKMIIAVFNCVVRDHQQLWSIKHSSCQPDPENKPHVLCEALRQILNVLTYVSNEYLYEMTVHTVQLMTGILWRSSSLLACQTRLIA